MRELTILEMSSVFGGEGCSGGSSRGGGGGSSGGGNRNGGDSGGSGKTDRVFNNQRFGPMLTEKMIQDWYNTNNKKGYWERLAADFKAKYPTWQDLSLGFAEALSKVPQSKSPVPSFYNNGGHK